MKYNGKSVDELTLDELNSANFDLAGKEASFNESLKNAPERIKKLNPPPQMGEAFRKLRQEIKNEIEKRKANA